MRRIAVVGASGFVGATLVEHLLTQAQQDEVLPFIHSSGNAWRLARLGIKLYPLNLLAQDQVEAAVAGCTHVVNCSRGDPEVMIKGLASLLAASRKHNIQRFIHLSSVLVYGDPPPPGSVHENAVTCPTKGTYGELKLQQDRMVMRACRAGLPSLILCPPNISGPHSLFLSGLVDALRAGKFAILEGGRTPCSLVDIGNLAHAIELSLERGIADGKRMFITDDESIEWGEVIARLVPLAELGTPVPSITHEELLRLSRSNDTPHISIARSLKHLVSSDVRQAMRKDPLWAKLDQMLRSSVAQLGHAAEDRLRLSIAGPLAVPKVISDCQYDVRLCSQQLRDVRHTSDLAKRELGYRTLYAFSKSMDAFIASYRIQHGMDTGNWDILRLLV